MTTTFYFNEVLPAKTEQNIVSVFEQTVIRAAQIAKKTGLVMPIVTSDTSDKLNICGTSLQEVINSSKNHDVQILGWHLFSHNNTISKYETVLEPEDYEPIKEGNYQFEGQDATNLAIAEKMEWPLLSMPLTEALQKDYLTLTSETINDIEVANYYAQEDTTFIERWIKEKELANLEGLAKLKVLLGADRVIVAEGFEKEWHAAIKQHQDIAYDRFKLCCDRAMLFPVRADDVTVQKDEVKGTPDVYELRQLGSGVRVYFGYSEDGAKMVLAGISTKAGAKGTEQNADIVRAQGRIRKALVLAQE